MQGQIRIISVCRKRLDALTIKKETGRLLARTSMIGLGEDEGGQKHHWWDRHSALRNWNRLGARWRQADPGATAICRADCLWRHDRRSHGSVPASHCAPGAGAVKRYLPERGTGVGLAGAEPP